MKYVAPGIQQRRKGLYAVQEIPKALRPRFKRARFVQSLKTDSINVAKRRAAVLIAEWKAEIERAKGEPTDDAAFFRQAFRRATTEDDKQALREQVSMVHGDMASPTITDTMTAIERHEAAEVAGELADDFAERATGAGSIKWLDHIDEYLDQSGLTKKTIAQAKTNCEEFAEIAPELAQVTRPSVALFILRKGHLKPDTIKRSISYLRGYWKWMQRADIAPDNVFPFDNLNYPKAAPGKNHEKRKHFTPADVVKLIDAADGTLKDLVTLAAYTGCRVGELCHLKVEDVHNDHFAIIDAKTAAGIRDVPIHPDIQQLVARLLDTSTDGYLLSDLNIDKHGIRGNNLISQFSRLKKSLGYGRDQVFHSIRKTVATMFEEAGVSEVLAARILGHKLNTMSYGLYSGGASVEAKAEAMAAIKYPDA